MEKTNIKEAASVAESIGLLAEKNLEVITTADGNTAIRGEMTLQTGEANFVTYNTYVSKITRAGKENSAYKGLETVMDTYVSIADGGKENATKVYVKGKIQPESYIDKNTGAVVERMKLSSNYFNRPKNTEEEPRANFEAEIYITCIIPEVYTTGDKQGETTGRIIVGGYLPMYGGKIEPIQFVAPEDIADDVESAIEVGETRLFTGDIVNSRIVVTKEIPMTIGKPKIDKKTIFKNEMIITGVSEAYDENMAYNHETIKKALAARDERLEEQKKKNSSTPQTQVSSKPAASGRTMNF